MSSETDRTFLISKRDTIYKGLPSVAETKVTLYTDIRRFYFRTDIYEKMSKTKLGDLQYNLSSSLTDEIYNALEKRLLFNEDTRVFMIFKHWVDELNLSESTAQEMVRVCSV